MEIIGLQWDLAWENKGANFDHARRLLEKAQPSSGSLVVLPEMFATGFSMNVGAIAEAEQGETWTFLSKLAGEFGVFVAGGTVTAIPDGRGRNEAIVFDSSGREVVRYCKMHPFRPAGEGDHYCEGPAPVFFRWNGMTVSPFICYDLRFPEIFRLAVLGGAEAFLVIASWPSARTHHWRTLLQARAIENQAYVLGVNRCGRDPKFSYPGATMAVDFRGDVLGDLSSEEGIAVADVDLESLRTYRKELPFLADMRREFFPR